MQSFDQLNLSNSLRNAIEDLGFEKPTPIQAESFPVILAGRDMVGIAQTGTGKTYAYMMPILRDLKFSKQISPRVLIVVPTRELVLQVAKQTETLAKYMTLRVLPVYGGPNVKVHMAEVALGCDILVATPGRLYDLVLSRALSLKTINKLVIDEVDVMLDLGFRFQLQNIFDLLTERRQNIMFSATMTDDVNELINTHFVTPAQVSIAVSGTPLENIEQSCFEVPNFYTKVNLLAHLLVDKTEYSKVLVFVSTKRRADLLFDALSEKRLSDIGIIHSDKTQNYRIRSIEDFDSGQNRILIATDIIARGLDLDLITHVFNFDTPNYPENYMHRIGRTGRAEKKGKSILFYTPTEEKDKNTIEELMVFEIPKIILPEEIEISLQLTAEEKPKVEEALGHNISKIIAPGEAFHEKKEKNLKENLGGSYRKTLAAKYKKPQRKGGKNPGGAKRK
ncbi:MAG: ATP-dependent RNA helicase RhlE [Roseivirga sp.]